MGKSSIATIEQHNYQSSQTIEQQYDQDSAPKNPRLEPKRMIEEGRTAAKQQHQQDANARMDTGSEHSPADVLKQLEAGAKYRTLDPTDEVVVDLSKAKGESDSVIRNSDERMSDGSSFGYESIKSEYFGESQAEPPLDDIYFGNNNSNAVGPNQRRNSAVGINKTTWHNMSITSLDALNLKQQSLILNSRRSAMKGKDSQKSVDIQSPMKLRFGAHKMAPSERYKFQSSGLAKKPSAAKKKVFQYANLDNGQRERPKKMASELEVRSTEHRVLTEQQESTAVEKLPQLTQLKKRYAPMQFASEPCTIDSNIGKGEPESTEENLMGQVASESGFVSMQNHNQSFVKYKTQPFQASRKNRAGNAHAF